MSRIKERPKTLRKAGGEQPPRDPALSEKRKRAMVGYLAIMFFVAFLLVVLSLFVQNRNLKQVNNDSLTLKGRMENLQTENRELREALAEHLLSDAQAAHQRRDTDGFNAAMEALEPYASALSQQSKEVYAELSADYVPADTES